MATRSQKLRRLHDERDALSDRRRRVLASLGDLDRAIRQIERLIAEAAADSPEKPKGGSTR